MEYVVTRSRYVPDHKFPRKTRPETLGVFPNREDAYNHMVKRRRLDGVLYTYTVQHRRPVSASSTVYEHAHWHIR